MTPDTLAELKRLSEQYKVRPSYGSEWDDGDAPEFAYALVNAADDLIDAAEKYDQEWMLRSEAEAYAHGLTQRIAALESALAKERERAERWKALATSVDEWTGCGCCGVWSKEKAWDESLAAALAAEEEKS